MTKELDAKDWKILYQLCQDARLSHNRIAKLVGLSKNAVTYRIERLKKKGVIQGFFTIINYSKLGLSSCNILIRTAQSTKEREKDLKDFLKTDKRISVTDCLLGEWDFLIEFISGNLEELNSFITDIKSKFSDIIDMYEIHSPLESYKVEQLPVELVEEKPVIKPQEFKPADFDKTDLQLLSELNKNSIAPLFELGDKLGLTYETVSARIKKLRESGIIKKFTAKVGLHNLGYDVYLILLELRKFSKEREQALKSYLSFQKNIRYSFLSGSRPFLFVYLAVKSSAELNTFLVGIKEKFSDIVINQKYLLSTGLLKYDLFPEAAVNLKIE